MYEPHKPKTIGLYVLLASFYCLSLTFFLATSISLDLRRERERFAETAYLIQNHIDTLTHLNLIALHGFAALLEVEGVEQREKVSAYARFILAKHPNIFMMEVAEKMSREALKEAIEEQRRAGLPEFQPKTFVSEGSRDWGPIDDKPFYYLLTFMEPLLPNSRDLLGLDIESVPFLRDSMQRAVQAKGVIASRPFRLVEGEKGYALILPIQRGEKELVPLVICKVSDLMPAQMPDQDSLSVGLYYAAGGPEEGEAWLVRREATVETGLASRLFPKLNVMRPIGGPEQPFMLQIEKQLDWRIINWDMLTLILVGAVILLPLLLLYARAHHKNEMRHLEEGNKLFYMANFDALTGLPNRQLFLNRLQQALAAARRQGQKHAVLYLDLDGFKRVNDYYGHAIGDMVLQWAARIFLQCVREMDTVARLGGDEFVILLQGVIDEARARSVARKIKKAFLQHPNGGSKTLPVIGVSIGIAIYPDDGENPADLLKAADQAMYMEKLAGRTRLDILQDA
jgi:diguanylate cyclase (GGDEF)-like protein